MPSTAAPLHPVLACAGAIGVALKDVADVEPMFMTAEEKCAALVELHEREAQLVELRLRVMAASDDVAREDGMRDVAAWFAHAVRVDPAEARRDLRLARALDRRTRACARGCATVR